MTENDFDALLNRARAERTELYDREQARLRERVGAAVFGPVAVVAAAQASAASASATASAGTAPVAATVAWLTPTVKLTAVALLLASGTWLYRATRGEPSTSRPAPATEHSPVVAVVANTRAAESAPLGDVPASSDVEEVTNPVRRAPAASVRRRPTSSSEPSRSAPTEVEERVDPIAEPPSTQQIEPQQLDAMRAEVRILARARRAIEDDDWTASELALREHAATYPQGLLREERRALQIITMCGRGENADDAMARFSLDYPVSAYRRRVFEACSGPR